MLGLLKRHEVETLLKAGHKRSEIARVTGISYNSVKRIAKEATIEHFDDMAERRKRRIGMPSIVQGFRNAIRKILQQEPHMPSLDILRQVQKAGYTGGKSALYNLVALLRPIEPPTRRNEAFEWMRTVQQGAIPRPSIGERKIQKGEAWCGGPGKVWSGGAWFGMAWHGFACGAAGPPVPKIAHEIPLIEPKRRTIPADLRLYLAAKLLTRYGIS